MAVIFILLYTTIRFFNNLVVFREDLQICNTISFRVLALT